MSFLLTFLFLFSLQTLEDNDNFYVIFKSADENPTFSSYRLSNPERIVFEANGSFDDADFTELPAMVKSVEKNVSGGMTRFVFFVETGAQYTFFNRKGTIIIAFSRSVFLDDDNFDTIMAKFTEHREHERLAQAEEEKTVEERLSEEYKHFIDEKRIAELKKAEEEKRLAEEKRIAELKKAEDEKRRIAAEKEVELVNSLMNELEKEEHDAEEKRIAELNKAEEEKRLAEEKRIAELKKAEEERRLAEEKRIAELKKAEEEKRLAEEKRIAELKKAEEERRLAEEKRMAELQKAEEERRLAEEKRMAELQKAEEEKRRAEEKRVASQQLKAVKSEEGEIKQLKVTKAEKEPTLSEKLPELPVTKLAKKGKLKNIFFRKFPDFSRVTMELDGEVDYQFREIGGGFVIDVNNFDKIPQYLLNIIDTRAFKAEVAYIYPKKADNVLKIYIKTDPGMAVRKSKDGKYVNFDFFRPTVE